LKIVSALICTALALSAASAAPPSESAVQEIEHLLGSLSTSGCQFYRNGKWYPSGKAVEHLRMKYNYLLEKDLVNSAEQFVERAATRSSRSGKPYQVRCGGDPVPSAIWLTRELQRYRDRTTR
jgi:hypothetical protein